MTESNSNDEPPTLSRFLEENHRLFTVFGVFAGLSVYLSDLGSPGLTGAKWGVSASLLLFIISGFAGIFKTYEVINNCRNSDSKKDILRIFPFSVVLYSHFVLIIAISLILNARYSDQTVQILISGVGYTVVLSYLTFLQSNLVYDKLRSYSRVSQYYRYSPAIGLLLSIAWGWYRIVIRGVQSPIQAGIWTNLGYVTSFIIIHFAFTILSLAGLLVLDYTVEYLFEDTQTDFLGD